MAARCVCCSHPDRDRINERLVSGEGATAVAQAFGLVRQSVQRHEKNHLRVSAQAVSEAKNALTIIGYAHDLYERADLVLKRAEALLAPGEEVTPRALLATAGTLREVRASIELLARLVVNDSVPEDDDRANRDLDRQIEAQLRQVQAPVLMPPQIEDAVLVAESVEETSA